MTLGEIDREGVLGACPFEVLHQFQLGLLKYILTSLFHYRSVPFHFLEWLDKRSSPDVPSIDQPGGISRSCPPSNEYDSPDAGHTKGGGKKECASQAIDIDSRSKLQQFLDWLKTRPSARDNKTASQDEMCFPEWVLKKPPALWMASWNVKAIILSRVCHIEQA